MRDFFFAKVDRDKQCASKTFTIFRRLREPTCQNDKPL